MKTPSLVAGLAALIATPLAAQPTPRPAAPPDLAGIWVATQRFGPDVRGTLLLIRTPDGWHADLAGHTVPVRLAADAQRAGAGTLTFSLPDSAGDFRGRLAGREIHGHWIQPRTLYSGGRYATPVTLVPDGAGRWRGTVTPLDDRMTFFLPLVRTATGRYDAFLRNPERNAGRFQRITRAEQRGDTVLLFSAGAQGETVSARGTYDDGVITGVRLRGAMYDFTRLPATTASAFYPRGNPPARYRYQPPLALADGWPVASVEAVGISRDSIERFVQMLIGAPMDSLASLQVHSLLVARHGTLVVEEYFHGSHRDEPHELRSASKTMLSVLVGAARTAGYTIPLDAPVYRTMPGAASAGVDPRKRAMTLEHLMSMAAGFECSPDSAAPRTADEDVIANAGIQDNYRYTLDVPLNAAPGDRVFYCSAEANLAGGMVERLTGESQLDLYDRLLARPLQLGVHHLLLQPSGEVYGGGGHHLTSRDFLKLAQLMLDGRWGKRQVLSRDWIERSRGPLRDLFPGQQYRLLWNSREYDHAGRKVRAWFAGGNGGQVSVAVPDLDLVIVITGGNYGAPATPLWRRVYGLQDILGAVR